MDKDDDEIKILFDEILSMTLKKKYKLCKEKINMIMFLLDMDYFFNDDLIKHSYDVFL